MALDKPLEEYIPSIPAGKTVTAEDIPATIEGATGSTVAAILADLAERVTELEGS